MFPVLLNFLSAIIVHVLGPAQVFEGLDLLHNLSKAQPWLEIVTTRMFVLIL